MRKHTPTPWTVEDPLGPEELSIVQAGKQTYEWQFIAHVPVDTSEDDGGFPPSVAHANAEFIVTACNLHDDLVAALRELQEAAVEVNCRFVGGSPLKGRLGDALDALANAEVKARIILRKLGANPCSTSTASAKETP